MSSTLKAQLYKWSMSNYDDNHISGIIEMNSKEGYMLEQI